MTRVSRLAIAAIVAALTSCVAVVDFPNEVPAPYVHLRQVFPDSVESMYYGPVTVEYELRVFNPFDHAIVLRSVDLHSGGTGWYHVARQTRRVQMMIPPGDSCTAILHVSAWASGGMASAYEPVTIFGVAWFDGPRRSRHRVVFEQTP